MSKLIDKLRAASQAAASPLGFGKAARAAPKPTLVLIASLAPESASRAEELAGGADGGLWRLRDAGALKSLPEKPATPDIPWGLWLPDVGREATERLITAGMDFAVITLKSSVGIFKEESGTGYVFQVDGAISDATARRIDDLPADALLLNSGGTFVTWQDLLHVHRFASLVDQPLLYAVATDVTNQELQMLWEAGIDGVVAEAAESSIASLRKQLDQLHEPPVRKGVKPGVLLPRVSAGAPAPADEEEEPEEEDED